MCLFVSLKARDLFPAAAVMGFVVLSDPPQSVGLFWTQGVRAQVFLAQVVWEEVFPRQGCPMQVVQALVSAGGGIGSETRPLWSQSDLAQPHGGAPTLPWPILARSWLGSEAAPL